MMSKSLHAFYEKMKFLEATTSEPENLKRPSLEALGYHFDDHGVMRDKVLFHYFYEIETDKRICLWFASIVWIGADMKSLCK